MSVNIVQNGELLPIAGKTVPAPTPDYVDAPYNSTTTYTKGMTCISGNKRYRYINSNATSGHQPPNATYWVEESVAEEIKEISKTLVPIVDDLYLYEHQTLATASSVYSSDYPVYRAFTNGLFGSGWIINGSGSSWVKIRLVGFDQQGSNLLLNKITHLVALNKTIKTISVEVLGSNDDSNYTSLKSFSLSTGQMQLIEFDTPILYSYIKFNVGNNYQSGEGIKFILYTTATIE